MTPSTAHQRAGWLLYAASQFVVLTAIAMAYYVDGYRFFGDFISELGATHAWSGRSNHVSMVLFMVALSTLGLAVIAFAGTWRAFTCTRIAVKRAGLVAEVFGTLSGIAFIAVAFSPVDVAMGFHNSIVVIAFGLLLGYVVAMIVVWSCNGAPRTFLVATAAYLLLVLAYFALAAVALGHGIGTPRAREILIVSQKVFAYASMLLILYMTLATRRLMRIEAASHSAQRTLVHVPSAAGDGRTSSTLRP